MVLHFGIIGCGNISQTYLYALSKNKDSQVVAVVDSDLIKAKERASLFNVSRVYSDYKQMLIEGGLDAVVICTPHYLHREQAISCAEYNLPILCEKPLATNLKDLEEMLDKCRNIPFGVMLQRRFYPNTIDTAEAVKRGLLGEIKKASLEFTCHKTKEFYDNWRGKSTSGGGVLISQALHRIDQLVYFFGEPLSVEGVIKTTRDYIEVEDYAKGKIEFNNKIVVDLEANNSSGNPETRSIITIEGTDGKIVLSDDKTVEWNVKEMVPPKEENINAIPAEYRSPYYGPSHEKVIDDFVAAIRDRRKPLLEGKDSLAAMKIIFGFYQITEENSKVNLK